MALSLGHDTCEDVAIPAPAAVLGSVKSTYLHRLRTPHSPEGCPFAIGKRQKNSRKAAEKIESSTMTRL
jgi:hypothetical protein